MRDFGALSTKAAFAKAAFGTLRSEQYGVWLPKSTKKWQLVLKIPPDFYRSHFSFRPLTPTSDDFPTDSGREK